jgi:DNA-binding LytR/AlgR family response regulator
MTEEATASHGLRVLAVDDEPPALGELEYLLRATDGVGEVVCASSATEALAALGPGGFDAIFCDIRMPGLSGLELAGIVRKFSDPPEVVFVTAYDVHAADAFDLDAVDYLRKPIRASRLAEAVRRVLARRADPATSSAAPAEPEAVDETIAVELAGVTRYVKRSDITFVEAKGDYVRLHTRTAAHLVRTPLAALEQRWAEAGFLRVHRQFLVNAAFVETLRASGGRLTVDLGGGQSVPVSRRHTAAVREALVRRHRIDRGSPPP